MGNVVKRPRLISGELIKFIDGQYKTRDKQIVPIGTQLLVRGLKHVLQCWKDKELLDAIVETDDTPLPDADELNAQIPEAEWETGLDGKPRPPWQLNRVIYLVDPRDASAYTIISATTGLAIAFDKLADQIDRMRWMRGAAVVPLIELNSRTMTTKFGEKQRPDLRVVDWRTFGGDPEPVAALPAPEEKSGGNGAEVKPADAKPVKAKAPKKQTMPGKPVEPVSIEEELNDELPSFA
jgi:hypothetical protein